MTSTGEHERARTRRRTRATEERGPRVERAQGCHGQEDDPEERMAGGEARQRTPRGGSGERSTKGQIGRGKSGVAAKVLSTLN